MTVIEVVEMFGAVAVVFVGGDFLELLILLDCGCLVGGTVDPVAVLDGATGDAHSAISCSRQDQTNRSSTDH